MKIGVLRKGDQVLNVTPEFIAVQRKNGAASTRSQKQPINGCMKAKPVITLKTDSTEENNQGKEEMVAKWRPFLLCLTFRKH